MSQTKKYMARYGLGTSSKKRLLERYGLVPKPWGCPICTKRFETSVGLARHLILDQSRAFELHWQFAERITGKSVPVLSKKGGYKLLAEALEKRRQSK